MATHSPEWVVAGDGCRIATLHGEGEGAPRVLAVHATGFCKEVWTPTVDPFLLGYPVLAFDQRGHGDSSTPTPPIDWWDLGSDVLVVLDAAGPGEWVGLGHSSGAAALIMAEVLCPGSFRALVLVEPIVFPGPFARAESNPLSGRALRRRACFPSLPAARAAFRHRGPFARWTDPALDAYLIHGFRPAECGWALKCTPEVEAEFYRGATAHGVWERMGEVSCPVWLVAGADSESHPLPFITRQRECFRKARLEILPGATHFLPMEQPADLGALVRAALADA